MTKSHDETARMPIRAETMREWFARHPAVEYRSRLDAELDMLAQRDDAEQFAQLGAAIGALRAAGAVLVPAFRTAESLVLYALGATGVDPVQHRMRSLALPPGAAISTPRWYAKDQRIGLPTIPCWQIVAADVICAGNVPPDWTRFDEDAGLAVVETWCDAFPEQPALSSPPQSLTELASMLALSSPLGNRLGLCALFHGTRSALKPSNHPLFAGTRGWPVFPDDVQAWLETEAGMSSPAAADMIHGLRLSDAAARKTALASLSAAQADTALLLHVFGPRMMPRSVAFAEATLAIIGARCLAADRDLALRIRDTFATQPRDAQVRASP